MDIVDRLKEQAKTDKEAGTLYAHQISLDAANEIEKLRMGFLEIQRSLISGGGQVPAKAFDKNQSQEQRCTENGLSIALCVLQMQMEELGLRNE